MEYFSESQVFDLIESNDIDRLNILLEKEPDFLYRKIMGDSLLHMAVDSGRYEMCDLLISKGLSVNVLNDNLITPIVEAARDGWINILELLISRGAKIDGDPRCITTPLISSVMHGNLDIIKKIVESGADINRLQMNFNRTALDIAIAYKQDDIVSYLQSIGARKAFEEMDFRDIEGNGILYHIYNNAGPILTDEYECSGIKLMTSWIGNGNHYKLFFTFGNFKKIPHTEFLICLPYNWPLNNAILNGDYTENFPMKLLSLLSEFYKLNGGVSEGFIIDKHSEQWSSLNWPDEIDGLVAVDYSFDHKENKKEPLTEDEEVTLLLLIPIKYTKSGVPNKEKLEQWINKKRTVSWKSIAFKMDWLNRK